MIELFGLIERPKSIKIACKDISYWHANTPTELVEYIENNLDLFDINVLNVKRSRVFNDLYIREFDIEIDMSNETYNYMFNRFQNQIARYNKNGVDVSLYRLQSLEE